MKSVTMANERLGNADEIVERARKIEDCISSVMAKVVSVTSSTNEFSNNNPTTISYSMAPRTNAATLVNEFTSSTSSVISKHKSLASSLPSLTGVMVNSSLSAIICRPGASATTTTTSTRSSRHLQLVGDLPENVLETSCTPPSSPSKLIQGHHQVTSSTTTTPLYASLTPINVGGIDSGQAATSTGGVLGLLSSNAIEDSSNHHQHQHQHQHHRSTTINSSSTTGAVFAANNSAAALTQLFPMATASSSSIPPAYLAVKVEQQEIGFRSASPMCGDNLATTCSSALMSPLQFTLATGGTVVSPNLTTLAAVAGATGTGGSLTNVSTNSDFLSLQPAAVYVQPIQQNGQVQYVRLELPAGISLASSQSMTQCGTGKSSSTVSTVELAHNIIATMFQQQPVGSSSSINVQQIFDTSESMQQSSRENEEHLATSSSMAPTFVLTEQSDPKIDSTMTAFRITTEPRPTNSISHVQQRSIPAGITVTAATPSQQQQTPASVASRKRASSSSVGQPLKQQQSLSKEAPSSMGNAGSVSGEDDGDDIFIDTKELCTRIAYELKAHSIPQAVFAERVLCRSQGTLSDLLRNPKPWNKLKSGRETFRRMYVWLKQPLEERLASLELWKGGKRKSSADDPTQIGEGGETVQLAEGSGAESPDEISSDDVCYNAGGGGGALISPRPDDPVASTSSQQQSTAPTTVAALLNEQVSPQRHHQQQRLIKKPRLVFTDIQKRTLQAIFKETQRPSREMQQTIAEHLNLDLSTVQNFFMNARRRSRIEQPEGGGDSPTPFQQVRVITPPPLVGMSSPVDANNEAKPNAQSSSTPTATAFNNNEKPKRPNRRPAAAKQSQVKNEHHQTESATTDNDHSRSLAFSGTTSPSHGIVTLPSLVLRNEAAGPVNGGGADVEGLLLDEDLEEEEFADEDDEDIDVSPHSADILEYGVCPSPDQQHESDAVGGETVVVSTSAPLVDVKPQRI